jgi:hypothetical protein
MKEKNAEQGDSLLGFVTLVLKIEKKYRKRIANATFDSRFKSRR